MIRVGHGFDVHAFADGCEVILGGVSIPCDQSLDAHSDGDVVLHAICDAILGAMAKGDIGHHFPDANAMFAGIDSRELLRKVVELMKSESLCLGNLDVTVVAQKPKLASHVGAMRENIASDCEAGVNQVNVKATTTERLGYVGREEGIAAHAFVLLCSVAG